MMPLWTPEDSISFKPQEILYVTFKVNTAGSVIDDKEFRAKLTRSGGHGWISEWVVSNQASRSTP